MNEVDLSSIPDDQFWSWLAGFSDGEACFALRFSGAKWKSYHPDFIIGLRADDWRILDAIQRRTDIGYTRSVPRRGGDNPQIAWHVTGLADSQALAVGFRLGCGLFAKKRRDFELWAEAVELIIAFGGGIARSAATERLGQIKRELHHIKEYHPEYADGWQERGGRRSTPRSIERPAGVHSRRAAKRFWNSADGTTEKIARQRRYAKLTQGQVDEIVARVLAGDRRVSLATEFGVSVQFIGNLVRGERSRRDGTLQPLAAHKGPAATSPEFWKTEAGQRAHKRQALLRGKLSQDQIDEIVSRYEAGDGTMASLAAEFGVSRPLVSKFIKGNYIRRD